MESLETGRLFDVSGIREHVTWNLKVTDRFVRERVHSWLPRGSDVRETVAVWAPRACVKSVVGLAVVLFCVLSPYWGRDSDLTYGPCTSWGPLCYVDLNGFLLWRVGAHADLLLCCVVLAVLALALATSAWAVTLEVNAGGVSQLHQQRQAGKLYISAAVTGFIATIVYTGACYLFDSFPWTVWDYGFYACLLGWMFVFVSGCQLLTTTSSGSVLLTISDEA